MNVTAHLSLSIWLLEGLRYQPTIHDLSHQELSSWLLTVKHTVLAGVHSGRLEHFAWGLLRMEPFGRTPARCPSPFRRRDSSCFVILRWGSVPNPWSSVVRAQSFRPWARAESQEGWQLLQCQGGGVWRGGCSAAQYFSISSKFSSFDETTHTPSMHCIDLCPRGDGKQELERCLALIFLCGPLSSASLLPVKARTFMHQRSSLKHSEVTVVDGASETHTVWTETET